MIRKNLLEIELDRSEHSSNDPPSVSSNDILAGENLFRQEADEEIAMFDLFRIAKDDSQIEPHAMDIESNNFLEFDVPWNVST